MLGPEGGGKMLTLCGGDGLAQRNFHNALMLGIKIFNLETIHLCRFSLKQNRQA
ncbi:hypothetical protein ACJX0J_028141, partial [Zea mays]